MLLAEGPKSIAELTELGIPGSSAAYDVKALLKKHEVKQITRDDVRAYELINPILPRSEALSSVILKNLRSTNRAVASQAAKDLDEMSMQGTLDADIIRFLVYEAGKNPTGSIYDALRRQAAFAKRDGNRLLAIDLEKCTEAASEIILDGKREADLRESAFLFLKSLRPANALELAFKIILSPDPAFKTPEPTSFAITVQGACVEAANQSAWRERLYDLLRSDDSTISARAKKILGLGSNRSFIPSGLSDSLGS
jgi:hypothetical protein